MWFCSECGDQFDPVEYRHPEPDGPNFCSSECEDKFLDCQEFTEIYWSAGNPAPVF